MQNLFTFAVDNFDFASIISLSVLHFTAICYVYLREGSLVLLDYLHFVPITLQSLLLKGA